jgi:hypothetical protein
MAAQDPSVFESPEEWKVRPLSKYKESSTMFADFALDENKNNLGKHSHVCPAKELSLQIFTRFLKKFSKLSYTSLNGDNVQVTEMGCSSVSLRLRTPKCSELKKQKKSCINFVDVRTGQEYENPTYRPEVFDNECFSSGVPKEYCIRYNQASWPWFFIAIYSTLFLKDLIQWKTPAYGFLLYSGFRMTEVINLPIYIVDGITAPLYSVAMFWGYICYSKDSMFNNIKWLLACHAIA